MGVMLTYPYNQMANPPTTANKQIHNGKTKLSSPALAIDTLPPPFPDVETDRDRELLLLLLRGETVGLLLTGNGDSTI